MTLSLVIIVGFLKFYFPVLLKRKFLAKPVAKAKPRYATFQKNTLNIAVRHFFFLSPCYMLPFPSAFDRLSRVLAVTKPLCSWGVTLRGLCEVPKKTDFPPQYLEKNLTFIHDGQFDVGERQKWTKILVENCSPAGEHTLPQKMSIF